MSDIPLNRKGRIAGKLFYFKIRLYYVSIRVTQTEVDDFKALYC